MGKKEKTYVEVEFKKEKKKQVEEQKYDNKYNGGERCPAPPPSPSLQIIPSSPPPPPLTLSLSTPNHLKFPTTTFPAKSLTTLHLSSQTQTQTPTPRTSFPTASTAPATTFHGLCYIFGDNIDTDQIIPASYSMHFVDPDKTKSKFSIVIGDANFASGFSREHAPVALGTAGVAAVVAKSYARIFFRNSVANGGVYPLELETRILGENDRCIYTCIMMQILLNPQIQ